MGLDRVAGLEQQTGVEIRPNLVGIAEKRHQMWNLLERQAWSGSNGGITTKVAYACGFH